jgi:hypothetical protein
MNRAIHGPRGEQAPIRGEGHRTHTHGVPLHAGQFLPASDLLQIHLTIDQSQAQAPSFVDAPRA